MDAEPKLREISSIDATVSSLIANHCNLAMTTRLAIIYTFERVFMWDFMSNSYTVWHIHEIQGPDDLVRTQPSAAIHSQWC